MYRILKVFTLLILFFSCKHIETYEGSSDDEVVFAFDKVKQSSIKRDISYLPRWQERIEFEGSLFIPMSTDKKLSSYTTNNTKYSLNRRIWLKAIKYADKWSFVLVTVLPNDNRNSKNSGVFLYEDYETGVKSYEGYIGQQLLKGEVYEREIRKINGKLDKRAQLSPVGVICRTISSEICAGSGKDEYCTYRTEVVCTSTTIPGGGNGGNTNPPVGSGGHGGGSGGGNNIPPIVVDDTPSDDDKEIIDSLQGYPCAQAILAKIPNLKNKISEWLSKEFNKSIDNDITFRVSTKLEASVDGVWNNNNGSGTAQTISLNANMLSKASQEYIAATMFHEALHGFLYMEEQRLKNEGKASQFGILYPGFTEVNIGGQVRFVKKHSEYGTLLDDLAAALRSFNPNISEYDAMALSKVGVVKDFSEVEKGTVINHRDGNYGTTCK